MASSRYALGVGHFPVFLQLPVSLQHDRPGQLGAELLGQINEVPGVLERAGFDVVRRDDADLLRHVDEAAAAFGGVVDLDDAFAFLAPWREALEDELIEDAQRLVDTPEAHDRFPGGRFQRDHFLDLVMAKVDGARVVIEKELAGEDGERLAALTVVDHLADLLADAALEEEAVPVDDDVFQAFLRLRQRGHWQAGENHDRKKRAKAKYGKPRLMVPDLGYT